MPPTMIIIIIIIIGYIYIRIYIVAINQRKAKKIIAYYK